MANAVHASTFAETICAIGSSFAAQQHDACVAMMRALPTPDVLDGATIEKLCGVLASIVATDRTPPRVFVAASDIITELAQKPCRITDEFAAAFVDLMVRLLARPGGSADGLAWPAEIEGDQEIAATHLDRFTQTVPRKAAPALNAAITRSLGTWGDLLWSEKVAIFIAVTYSVEGCKLELDLNRIMQLQDLGVRDSHPQVQDTALFSIRQCCSDVFSTAMKVDALRHHVDLLISLLSGPQVPLGESRLQLLRAVLSYTDKLLDALKPMTGRYLGTCQVSLLLQRTVEMLKGGSVDCSVTAAALNLLGTIINDSPSYSGPWIPEIMEIALPLLRPSTARDRTVVRSALRCATLTACVIGAEKFKPFEARTCEFLSAGMDTTKDDDPFMIRLLCGWACMAECLGRGIEQWLPKFVSKLIAGASVDAEPLEDPRMEAKTVEDGVEINAVVPVAGARSSVASVSEASEFKGQCFVILRAIARLVPLTALGKDLVKQFASVGCNNVACAALPTVRENAMELVEAILISQRKDGGDTTQYLPPDAVESFVTALETETDEDLRRVLIRCMTWVVASVHDVVPMTTTMRAIRACMGAVARYEYAGAAELEHVIDTKGDGSVLKMCWILGFLLRASVPGDDHLGLLLQAHAKFEQRFCHIEPVRFSLRAAYVAHGPPADVVAKKTEFTADASAALALVVQDEAVFLTVQTLQFCTEWLDLTARVEGFILDREFVMAVVRTCHEYLVEDMDADLVRSAVRAAIAAAEWLRRNNAPGAAGAAAAMCAHHLELDEPWDDSVVDANETTAIVDHLAHWAADLELSAAHFTFPMSRDDVIKVLGNPISCRPLGQLLWRRRGPWKCLEMLSLLRNANAKPWVLC